MEKGTQLSEKVTQILLHEIRNGDFNGLDSLPPEVELAEKFNVSRNVIRESLARLEREGWVVRKHGIGTLINKSVVHVDTRLDLNFELNQTLELSGKHAKTEWVRTRIDPANATVAAQLNIPVGEQVLRVARMISADGRPAIFCVDYLPMQLIENNSYQLEDLQPPIFEFMKKFCSVSVETNLSELRALPVTQEVADALNIPLSCALLFAVGGASCMARALGRHEDTDARCIAAISFWWCLLAAVLFSVVFAWLASPLLHLCGATSETYALAFHYAKWVVIWGGPCAIINILLANLLRAEGSAGIASAGVSLGGLINITLDPLFVLPQFLGLGAQGAGLATAISNGIGTLFLLFCIFNRRRSSVVSLRPGSMRYTAKYRGSIVKIGFPSCAQYLLTMVAVGALMKFMSAYDTDAVAALGIVKKLDMLPLYFSIGVSGGILPLLAYNYAAGNQERRHQVFKLGCGVSVVFSLVCVLTYELLAPMLVGLFIDTPATVAYGASFLRIMVLAMPMMAVCYPMITQFQAMGRVKESLICSVLRKGVLDIPLLFLLNGLLPMYGCTMVQPIVDCVSMLAALWLYRRILRQEGRVR